MQAVDTKTEKKIGNKIEAKVAARAATPATAKLPHLVTALPGPQAKALVARDHAILSPSYTRDYPLGRQDRPRRDGRRRGRQPIPRFRRRHRRRFHRPLPSRSRRRHPEASRRTDSHVRHGFLLSQSGGAGGKARRARSRQGSQARLFRQFRRRSHRSRHQARALSHQARQAHRLLRQLPRTHDGRACR